MASKDSNDTNHTNVTQAKPGRKPLEPLKFKITEEESTKIWKKYWEEKLLQEELEINADILKSFGIDMPEGCRIQKLVEILSEHSNPEAQELAEKLKVQYK